MDKQTFHNMALELKEKYLKEPAVWRIAYNRRKRGLGLCSYKRKTIYFSDYFIAVCTEAEARNVITHELAHADLSLGHGHGRIWQNRHKLFGGDGERLNHGLVSDLAHKELTQPKYTLICNNCGYETAIYRRPSREKACGKCCNKFCGGRYDSKFKMRLIKNR